MSDHILLTYKSEQSSAWGLFFQQLLPWIVIQEEFEWPEGNLIYW